MKKITIGMLAHVDAGKTTLSESMLYVAGSIRKLGRVDHQDTFLDYDIQERNRGITIFSKQADLHWKDTKITLLDTPGHVDFSTEMERTLQILDYAILIINGLDGVQTHTKTVWDLLYHYQIPTFIFVNKMDMKQAHKEQIYAMIQDELSSNCIDFTAPIDEVYEQIALTNDFFLETYFKNNKIDDLLIKQAIVDRELFPCFFGSALKIDGIEQFIDGLIKYTNKKQYSDIFGAKVFKISRDEQGSKLTHMKITGGVLKVKSEVLENEKVDQIRQYSGHKYTVVQEATAGNVYAVTGLKNIYPGQGLGMEKTSAQTILSPYMSYRLVLPSNSDVFTMLKQLQQLAQEDPQLRVRYQQQTKDIHLQLMGEVQTEVLKHIIKERFDVDVTFAQGNIIYKETILEAIEGVGHYEPLGHYAEVHLTMEPGELGSGLQFATTCKQDVLHQNYQRLILSHLEEKEHIGVLTGSPITDMKITLVTGKAHLKHTVGGDFREATYRAVRQGLHVASSILLEPYYRFQLEIPVEHLSKAIYDIEQMHGQYSIIENGGQMVIIEGSAPISKMQNYQSVVISYTKGQGKLFCIAQGYRPCHNQQEIIDTIAYDSAADKENPASSIFCRQGAGFSVPWDLVREHMHVDSGWGKPTKREVASKITSPIKIKEEELETIFTRTYGPLKRRGFEKVSTKEKTDEKTASTYRPECLVIDGYNVIHAWHTLKALAKENLDAARAKLIDVMSNYQGYKQNIVIIVFDAYKVKGNTGSVEKYDNIYIIYTKESQTADAFIERATHQLSNSYAIMVATSDALEQLIVIGQGAHRISSRELELEVEYINKEQLKEYDRKNTKGYNYLLADMKDLREDHKK